MIVVNFYYNTEMRRIGLNFYTDIILVSLEIFRRFIWNIFRLENEQLSNIDQYRVTNDIPLRFERYSEKSHSQSSFLENIIFKLCPFTKRKVKEDHAVTLEDFLKRQKYSSEENNELDDLDELKVDKLERSQSELRFDAISDTKNDN